MGARLLARLGALFFGYVKYVVKAAAQYHASPW